jgi:hypothetical protein
LNTFVASVIGRFFPGQRYRFTPIAPKTFQVSPAQKALLDQYDIRHIELHIVEGFYAPVQETRWGDFYRAEDYTFDQSTPNDAFFLRRRGDSFELRLGPVYSKLTPEDVSLWIDSLLKTSMSRIEWLSRNSSIPKVKPVH